MENQKLLKQKLQKRVLALKKNSGFSIVFILNFLRKYNIIIIFFSLFLLLLIILFFFIKILNQDNIKNEKQIILLNNTIDNDDNNIIKYFDNNKKYVNHKYINSQNKIRDNFFSLNETDDLEKENNVEEEKKNENNKNMTKIIDKANKYISKCLNGILITNLTNSTNIPKITAIIAVYNSEKTIKSAIRSIQNQKMKDIEIIIVNDASTDKSLEIIRQMQNEDKRIKIIENEENKGPLYSKSIGVIQARGKYIMQLDSDDLFINEKIFDICYIEAEKNNLDILEFSGFRSRNKIFNLSSIPRIPIYLRNKENNVTIKQPELSNFIYKKYNNTFRLIDGYLWGKCIKTEVYRKALDILGENIYNQKIYYGDDRIVNFILFRVSNTFKFINEYGIVYYNTANSILNSYKNNRNCHDELINIMNIFNFTKNSYDSEIAAFEIIYRWKYIILPGLNKENSKYAINLIKEIMKCKFISNKRKRIIYTLWINRKK